MKKLIYGVLLSIFLWMPNQGISQDSWDWRDPNDFGLIDFGDNKLLGYNLIGVGLSVLLNKAEKEERSWIREISIGRLHEYQRTPLSRLWIAEYRIGKAFRKYLTIGGGLRGYLTEGSSITTTGVGGNIWFSWHIIRQNHWRLSYDNGVGPNFFFNPFPLGGTKFNFTTHYGLSFQLLIDDRWLQLRFTNIHISNAGIKGMDRNPALDAIGLVIGVSI